MKAVFWAGVGTLFPFLMTITGAALVFLLKNQKEDGPCMGFAAGVMSAAAVFSMLLPAMRQKAGGWLTVTLGFALGAAMIAGVDAFLGRTQRLQGVSASAKRRLMMYAAITLIPMVLPLAGMFYEKELLYTFEDYQQHLSATQKFAEEHSNYTIITGEPSAFRNIQIQICKGRWVLVTKNKAPAIHFVIRHPKMLHAFENFVISVTEPT